jgi:hypothetical protein
MLDRNAFGVELIAERFLALQNPPKDDGKKHHHAQQVKPKLRTSNTHK